MRVSSNVCFKPTCFLRRIYVYIYKSLHSRSILQSKAMAADSSKSSGSADCYIGSFISLISKAEIRYEGFLFHINPQESTMGLRNVKSFGTEGRRKDGPQVLPSDKVYEYIFFRGRDIKDLQVISSPPVQSTPDVPNDPAIIQSHYPRSTSASSSFPSASAVSATNISSDAQLGLPNSIFQGNLPLSQPTGSLGSWGSFPPPPTGNGNGIVVPTYWPGHSGSSEGVSHLQQQSLLRPSQEFSDPMLPAVGSGSPSLTSSMRPPSVLPSSVLIGQSDILPSKLSPNLMPNIVSNGLPTVTWGSNSPLASPLMASSLDVNSLVPPVMDKPESVFDPALPYQAISQSMPSIIGSSSPVHSEASIPSLLTPGQILQPGPTGRSSRHFQTAHKDIEVVQISTSELLLPDSKSAKDPAHPLPSPTAEKLNKTALHTYHSERDHARGKGNWLNGSALRSHHSYRGHARGRANGLNGAVLYHHQSNRGHARGRANGLTGAALHPHQSNRGHYQGRKNGPNTADIHTHCSDRVRGRGKGAQVSPTMNKFTEDFDFEEMNEKFNKEEIWGHLGKSKQTRLEVNEGEENHNDANVTEEEDEDGLPKFDAKPVYVKDDFFDLLSCNSFNRESGRGRAKFSEQRKIDIETFGEIPRHRRGPSSQGPGWGGRSRGSHRGRGYGYVGRGRGRAVWGSHVT